MGKMVNSKLEKALDFQTHYEKYVDEAVEFLKYQIDDDKRPEFGIVLGSGLGDIADSIKNPWSVDYAKIPHFPTPTVKGHEGRMLIGELEGVPVIGLKGRKHYYEVADEPFNTGMLKVIFPIHVLAGLKVPNYFVTCAVGGLNLNYNVGDIMAIRSHFMNIPNPLLGRKMDFKRVDDGDDTWRFDPMNNAYDPGYRRMLLEAGLEHEGHIHEGDLMTMSGPTYETERDCLVLRDGFGVDAVGMSTSPEVTVARHRGMDCVGMACITNKVAKDGTNATNHEEVKRILESAEVRNKLSSTVKNFFRVYRERQG